MKINPSGTAADFVTLFPGTENYYDTGIAPGPDGSVYLTGTTSLPDFPVSDDAFQSGPRGQYARSAFFTQFSGDGTKLLYSTYLGGSLDTDATGLAVDSLGNAYFAGYTRSQDFPVTPGALSSTGAWKCFGARWNVASHQFDYIASFGVSTSTHALVAVDPNGRVVFGGSDKGEWALEGQASAVPVRINGAFLLMLNESGSGVSALTTVGGEWARLRRLVFDRSGNLILLGDASDASVPPTVGAYRFFPPQYE